MEETTKKETMWKISEIVFFLSKIGSNLRKTKEYIDSK